jgi:hypothetical protein
MANNLRDDFAPLQFIASPEQIRRAVQTRHQRKKAKEDGRRAGIEGLIEQPADARGKLRPF